MLHKFIVYATDSGVPARRSKAEVVVRVQDENDNSPIFVHPPDNLSIRENKHISILYAIGLP